MPQLDPIGFDDVKQRTPRHVSEKIKKHFGINISQVQYRELAFAPFLSLLFCRLFYRLRTEEIPATVEGRAAYWKRHYNTIKGKGTVEKYIQNQKANQSGLLMFSIKTKIFVPVVVLAILSFAFVVNKLKNARIELGATQQQNVQLISDIEGLNVNLNETVSRLEQQQKLNETLSKQRDEARAKIQAHSRRLQNALIKLNRNNKEVQKWSDSSVPADVVKLLNESAENSNNKKDGS